MKTITVPTREQVSPEAQPIFDNIKKSMGKVPNLLVTLRTFTNYVYANTQIPVDFPAYEPLV